MEWMRSFFQILDASHIAAFPYFLTIAGGATIFFCRKSEFISRYGLQIVTMAILLPALLFAWNRMWISNDAGVAVLSGITGYVFGSGGRNDGRSSRGESN